MNRPQDDRPYAPSNRRTPIRPAYTPDPSAATDDPYRPRRSAGEGTGPPAFGRPERSVDDRPSTGYYSTATRQRPAPRAGRIPEAVPAAGDSAGLWGESYAGHPRDEAMRTDRPPGRHDADDDWDTHVFSLLPGRAAANERDPSPQGPRRPTADERKDAGGPGDAGRSRTEAVLARQVAGIASLAAGVVHVFSTPTHWQEWLLAGVFFAVAAGFQLLWGLLALRIGGALFRMTGLLANLGLIGLWALTRWYGLPFGPHAGAPEAFGAADLITAAMEAAIVIGLLWSLLPRERHGVFSAGAHRAVVVLAFLVLGAMAVPGSTAALEHSHSHDPGTADHEDDGHLHEHGVDESADMNAPADAEPSAGPDQEASEEEDHTHAPGEEHD